MAIEPSDMEQIIEAVQTVVEDVVRRRMEEVYGTLEQLREEWRSTVAVLDGNDRAIIEHIKAKEGDVAVEYMELARAAWERFVKGEAREMGLRVVKEKSTESKGEA